MRLLHEGLTASAHAFPDKVAVIVDENSYTYAELLQTSLRLAGALQQRGLKPGDRVVIFMGNSWSAVVAIFAVLFAGGVFVVVNSQAKSEKLRFILDESDAKILLTNSLHKHIFLPILETLNALEFLIYSGKEIQGSLKGETGHTVRLEQFDSVVHNSILLTKRADVIPLDLATLIYTSGSTGYPKGVMQTHQAMVFTVGSLIEYLRLSREERILNILPLAFDYGLYQLFMSINLGATLVLEHSFTYPAQVYNHIKEQQVTVFPGVPTIFSMMLASHSNNPLLFDSVKTVTNTAAKLPAGYIESLREIFPNGLIYKMYGLTECKRVSYLAPELVTSKPESVGKAIPGTQVFLLSGERKPVSTGETGILHVRGPHIMLGYWKNPELSATMLVKLPGSLPHERVLCTHDLFTMDADGDLYFIGRTDEIIKSRGEKVSPAEVENVIQNIAGVRDVAVVGIPDDELGEAIYAFISVDEKIGLNSKKIMRVCQARLENYLVPQEVVFLPELPKSLNGKIDKKALIKMESTNYNVY